MSKSSSSIFHLISSFIILLFINYIYYFGVLRSKSNVTKLWSILIWHNFFCSFNLSFGKWSGSVKVVFINCIKYNIQMLNTKLIVFFRENWNWMSRSQQTCESTLGKWLTFFSFCFPICKITKLDPNSRILGHIRYILSFPLREFFLDNDENF